jgi:hypothetical protein
LGRPHAALTKLGKELQSAEILSLPGANVGFATSQCEWNVLFASFSYKKKKEQQ